MAYYVRTFKSGAGDYDPRQITWAVYQCDECGGRTDFRIPDQRTYQYIDRACEHCGSVHPGDRTKALTIERNRLQDEVATRLNRIAEIDAILSPAPKEVTPCETPCSSS